MVTYVKELLEIFQTFQQDMKKMSPHNTVVGNKFGITGVQLMTLGYISHNENCKTSDISTLLSVSPSDATRVVDTLFKKGFVERINDEIDRRIIRLRLTIDGKKVFETVKEELASSLSKILEKMNEQDAKALLKGLRSFLNVLNEIDQK